MSQNKQELATTKQEPVGDNDNNNASCAGFNISDIHVSFWFVGTPEVGKSYSIEEIERKSAGK